MRNLHLTIIVIILLFMLAGAASYAAEEAGSPPGAAAEAKEDNHLPFQQEDQWQILFTPYLWIPGINVDVTFLGHTAGVRESWWEIAGKLFTDAIGAMGRIEARKDRWGFYLDSYVIYLEGNVSDSARKEITMGRQQRPRTLVLSGDLNYIVRAGGLDFGLRYLVGTLPLKSGKPLPNLSFEGLGGGRFNWYNQDLYLGVSATFTGGVLDPNAEGTFKTTFERELVEPFLGMRLSLWLTEMAVIAFQGTVGGFGIMNDDNLDSVLDLALGFRVHKSVCTYLGYRARYEQCDEGELSISAWFHGPMLGAMFAF
jgi:hypothetical protein